MENVLTVGIVFFTIYKTIELFVRQKERRLMVEKMTQISPELLQSNISSLQAAPKSNFLSNQFLMLRLGAVAFGIGAGWLLGLIIKLMCDLSWSDEGSVYVAGVSFCAGIALIIVYLIEQKAYKEAKGMK